MYTKNKFLIPAVLVLLIAAGCKKWNDYQKYQTGGELTYPGGVDSVVVSSGNSRIKVDWKLSPDPNVTRYKLYWNDKQDSLEGTIPETTIGNKFSILVDGLSEGSYNFILYTLNSSGDLSVPSFFSGRVVGESYVNSLLNRAPAKIDFADDRLTIHWGVPDTVNVGTEIRYTNTMGQVEKLILDPDSSQVVISDWKRRTPLYYQSYYKPNSAAIDTFSVSYSDSIIVKDILVDKTKWKKSPMSTDVQTDFFGTDLSKIWDGLPGGYPNIYHSAEGTMPQHFTFDMGASYADLTAFEAIGRQDCACSNPVEIQVWGIADTTGAATALAPDDAGWEAESVAKGWSLLTTMVRTDNGVAPFRVQMPAGLPAVRFIRIRVMKTVDNNPAATHMSEVTFWYNP